MQNKEVSSFSFFFFFFDFLKFDFFKKRKQLFFPLYIKSKFLLPPAYFEVKICHVRNLCILFTLLYYINLFVYLSLLKDAALIWG